MGNGHSKDFMISNQECMCWDQVRATVAQWVKCWPADLVVPGSSRAQGEIFSAVNRGPVHTTFHYHMSIILI